MGRQYLGWGDQLGDKCAPSCVQGHGAVVWRQQRLGGEAAAVATQELAALQHAIRQAEACLP